MKRTRRVTTAFSAKQLHREPLRHESFRIGERLVFLRYQEGHTVFSRERECTQPDRAEFIIDNHGFLEVTQAVE